MVDSIWLRIGGILLSLVLIWGNQAGAVESPRGAGKGSEIGQPQGPHKDPAQWEAGLEKAGKAGDLKQMDQFLSSLAGHYEGLGQYEKALEYRQQALEVNVKTGDRVKQSATLLQLGVDYQQLMRFKEAISSYEQGLALKRASKDRLGEFAVLMGLTGAYMTLNQYEKALGYCDQATALLGTIENQTVRDTMKYGIISLYTSIYFQLGLFEIALNYHEQGLAISRKSKNQFYEGIFLIGIGTDYGSMGQKETALKYYTQALELARRTKDRRLEATALMCAGVLWKDKFKQPEKASDYFKKNLAINQELKDKTGEWATLNAMAALDNELGQHEKALGVFEQQLAISREMNNLGFIGADLLGQGMTYTSLGQYDKAQQALKQSLDIYNKIGMPLTLWLSQYALGKLGAKKGAPEEAISYYEQALATIESVRAGLSVQEAKTSFLKDKLFVYDEFIEYLKSLHDKDPSKGYDRKSWEIFERKQGRVLLEGIGKIGARNFRGLPPEIQAKESDLETRLQELRQRRSHLLSQSGGGQTSEKMAALEKEMDRLKSDLRSLQAEIKEKYPDYYALKYPKPATLQMLQEKLGPEEVILVYGVMEKATYLWLISNNNFGLYPIGIDEKELSGKITEFRSHLETVLKAIQEGKPEAVINRLAQTSIKEIHQSGKKIYDLLIPEAAGTIIAPAKTLYIVPTGPLYALPFEALAISSKPNPPQYLLERQAVAYLSSASLLKTLRQAEAARQHQAKYPLLIFANPVYRKAAGASQALRGTEQNWRTRAYLNLMGGSFSPLPETEEEAKEIKAIMEPPDQSQPLQLQKEASRWNVLDLQKKHRLADYRYLVFSCHGLLPDDVDQVRQPALVLSHPDPHTQKEGFLTMADVFNLQLNADLVTLSACNTGRGAVEKGEGVVGLTRSFMYAGTSAISVTLWSVESGSAKLVTTGLFKNIKAGRNRAEALRNIKLEFIKGDKGKLYQHPFFWAPMIIFGNAGL